MAMFSRDALDDLRAWKARAGRKPLVIRGARQVGKSVLVRLFGQECFQDVAEINFERDPDLASLFVSNDPAKIVALLEMRLDRAIRPGSTLLFLDEIQAAPAVFSTLRYFYEQMPELHVVAAGSLLDLVLGEVGHAMPVGRIEYLHLGPLTFDEFLRATGKERLAAFLGAWTLEAEIPEAIHRKALEEFRAFLVVGGMPEVVAAYADGRTWSEVDAAKHSILATYRDDFGKYGHRANHARLLRVFSRLPAMVGARFKYANVDREERSGDLAKALDLLCRARVAYRVTHTSANGVPLAAQTRESVFKVLFLDVGLQCAALGLRLLDVEQARDVLLVNAGAVCEQAVGQHLLHSLPRYREPEVHFWTREKANAAAEVDYVFAEGPLVMPVEVKAGKTGTLKSLHVFMGEKGLPLAVRLNSDGPSLLHAAGASPDRSARGYRMVSLPVYLAGQVRRVIASEVERGKA